MPDCAMEGKQTLNYLGNVSQSQEEWVAYRFLVAVQWGCPVNISIALFEPL